MFPRLGQGLCHEHGGKLGKPQMFSLFPNLWMNTVNTLARLEKHNVSAERAYKLIHAVNTLTRLKKVNLSNLWAQQGG